MGMFQVVINTPVKYTKVCKKDEDKFFSRSDPALYHLFTKEDLCLADVLRLFKGNENRSVHHMRANDWAKIMDVDPDYVVVTKSTEKRIQEMVQMGSPMRLSDRPLLVMVNDLSEIDETLFKVYGYFSLK